MKTHTRSCPTQGPCLLEHTYFCKWCGEEFITDETTQWRDEKSGITFPIETWPYCSQACMDSDRLQLDPFPVGHLNETPDSWEETALLPVDSTGYVDPGQPTFYNDDGSIQGDEI